MPTKIVVNCTTGVAEEVEMTDEEIAQKQADAEAFALEQQKREAEAQAREATRQAGLAKLIALGLTEAEAQVIVG